jgi:hypothetical protein
MRWKFSTAIALRAEADIQQQQALGRDRPTPALSVKRIDWPAHSA